MLTGNVVGLGEGRRVPLGMMRLKAQTPSQSILQVLQSLAVNTRGVGDTPLEANPTTRSRARRETTGETPATCDGGARERVRGRYHHRDGEDGKWWRSLPVSDFFSRFWSEEGLNHNRALSQISSSQSAARLMAGDGAERVVRGFALMHDDAMEVTANAESDDPPTEKDTPMADASGSRGFASPSNDKDKDKDGAGRPFRSRKPKPKSTRICALCPSQKASAPYGLSAHVEPSIARGGTIPPPMGEFAGPFLKDKNNIKTTYAHQNCIMWCPEVYFCANKDGLKHVEDGLKRGNKLKCAHCGKKGAAVGCMLPACNRTYHLKCGAYSLSQIQTPDCSQPLDERTTGNVSGVLW